MTGDSADIQTRLKLALPKLWFSGDGSVIGAVLLALSTAWAWAYSLYAYIKLQSRVLTASDGWLDVVAADFFGLTLTRKLNQSDTSYRRAIVLNLFRERATRKGVIQALTQLTGRTPVVIEPLNPIDTGAYGAPNTGYGAAGFYGSALLPYQCFVKAYRPTTSGIPNIAGYGNAPAAYGVPSQGGEYASMDMVTGGVTDAEIYAAVDSVKPVGTTVWVQINN